jgi:hypothetical protein
MCNVSLSKKLRSLVKDGETKITLVCNNVVDGRGEAKLVIISEDTILIPNDFINKETSIMLTPVDSEIENTGGESVGSIFSGEGGESGGFVGRLAVTDAPNEKKVATSIKSKDQINKEAPKQFGISLNNPSYQKFVSTVEELLAEAKRASETKNSKINLDSITNTRQKALAMELKEKEEAIDKRAFIVNDKCASLTINDLGINLGLNIPFDLSNISAKRILLSRELISAFKSGLIKIVSPDDVPNYHKKLKENESHELKTFSNKDAAERDIENRYESRDGDDSGMIIELGGGDLDGPSEQEKLASEVGKPVLSGTTTLSGGVRKSVHGGGSSNLSNRPPSSPGLQNKAIRKIER